MKQRSRFQDRTEIGGFPAVDLAHIDPPTTPAWALGGDDLPVLAPGGRRG